MWTEILNYEPFKMFATHSTRNSQCALNLHAQRHITFIRLNVKDDRSLFTLLFFNNTV